jgi:FtsP/CotA-like multicopper oxidase with cupredoxin domain
LGTNVLNRRKLLALGGVAAGGMVAGPYALWTTLDASAAEQPHAHGTGSIRPAVTPTYTPFSLKMPVPPVLAPSVRRSTVDVYRVPIRVATAEILPGVSTQVLTFNGSFPGPTIRTPQGRRAAVTFVNQLDAASNVHLHGGHTAATSDGHPLDVIQPGASRAYDYGNTQAGATLWYHDHAHHLEAEHVYRGLQGFYLIEGSDEAALNLPSGAYDVPIMLRDAGFDDQGALVFDLMDPNAYTTLLANGKAQPYFPVAARKYRFRFLNGATLREFTLNLGGVPMTQIGSDGGLLPTPVTRTELVLGPAERADVVIDFTGKTGQKLVLEDAFGGSVMRFDVGAAVADRSRVPARLRALPVLPAAAVTRKVTLGLIPGEGFAIDGKLFDPNRVDFQVQKGATEIWEVTNQDTDLGIAHTFHMHLAQFQVLDRNGGAVLPGESGFKDTVLIRAGETVRVKATFTDFTGRYVYHCHMLEHSELGMMAQMEIVP